MANQSTDQGAKTNASQPFGPRERVDHASRLFPDTAGLFDSLAKELASPALDFAPAPSEETEQQADAVVPYLDAATAGQSGAVEWSDFDHVLDCLTNGTLGWSGESIADWRERQTKHVIRENYCPSKTVTWEDNSFNQASISPEASTFIQSLCNNAASNMYSTARQAYDYAEGRSPPGTFPSPADATSLAICAAVRIRDQQSLVGSDVHQTARDSIAGNYYAIVASQFPQEIQAE